MTIKLKDPLGAVIVASEETLADIRNSLGITPGGAVSSVAGKTGVVTLTKTDVGLSNVDNTTDMNKPVSTAQAVAIAAATGAVASVAGKTGVVTLVKGDVGLSSVDNTSDAAKPISSAQAAVNATLAPLASPALTGVPVAPTASAGTSTTQIATTAFVTSADAGKADVLTPVALTGATTLNRASHGNRQITFSGASANLTLANDATGLWAADDVVEVHTLTGSAGVPTIIFPDGKTITGSTDKIVGGVRKGANSWTTSTTDPAAGGGTPTFTRYYVGPISPFAPGVNTEQDIPGASVVIPFTALGNTGVIKVSGACHVTSGSGGCTLRPYVGTTRVGQNASFVTDCMLINRGAHNSNCTMQALSSGPGFNNFQATTQATSPNVTVKLTGQLAISTDTHAIDLFYVDVFYGA